MKFKWKFEKSSLEDCFAIGFQVMSGHFDGEFRLDIAIGKLSFYLERVRC